jgi:hypothetical protein
VFILPDGSRFRDNLHAGRVSSPRKQTTPESTDSSLCAMYAMLRLLTDAALAFRVCGSLFPVRSRVGGEARI